MSLDVEAMKGKIMVLTGPVRGGKTGRAISYAHALQYSIYGVALFTNDVNTRDSDRLVSRLGLESPAHVAQANDPNSILEKIYELDEERQRVVIVLSEANFYNHRIIPVVKTLRDQHRVVIVEGLDRDFRAEEFKTMGKLQLLADIVERHPAYCQVLANGTQCSKPAPYSVRALKTDNPHHPHRIDFRRDGKVFRGQYRFAPYHDPTVIVEQKTDDEIVYTTACQDHFKIPGKQETADILSYIAARPQGTTHEEIRTHFDQGRQLEDILTFLHTEKRIKKEGSTLRVIPWVLDIETSMYLPQE